jgi:L-aminopeptidase/D-esterase-like protein
MTTWTISQLDRKTSDGFVTTAHWRATAVDGDHSASVYSTCSWTDGEVTIPYEDLTEQDVLDWVWVSVDKAATEAALAAQIAAQKNPVTAAGVPW